MIIRQMMKEDIKQLSCLYEQFWNEKSDPNKMYSVFQKIRNNPDYIILNALDNNQLVGSILGIICKELYGNCNPFMVIEDFVVDINHRRQGIGKSLFNEMEKKAVENECCPIILVTEIEREDAQGFYESVGFQKNKFRGYKKSLF
jgi:ribosomal protein S18 acetylase RimI-like enzyme